LEIRNVAYNWAPPDLASCTGSALPVPSPMKDVSLFSNEWLNFKHSFWAARSREKGIFAAFHSSRVGSIGAQWP
jgi:hypothetical protein